MSASLSPLHPHGIAKSGFPTDLPADYYVRYQYGSFGFYLDGYGLIEDGFGCEASARWAAQDHAAAGAEEDRLAAEAAAEAAADTHDELAQSVSEFFHAVDHGLFGDALRFDGVESAFVSDMRAKLASVQATVAIAEAL